MLVIDVILFLILIPTSLFIVGCLLFLLPPRQEKLRAIISDLEQLRNRSPKNEQYAIDENIIFFEAIKFLPTYLVWGIFHRPKVKPELLLEIADMNLPKWEKELYENLTVVERRNFPGLTKPLRKLLVEEITHGGQRVLVDLGCGSMEATRQVLIELRRARYDVAPVFIGIDSAMQAYDSIKQVFSEFGNDVNVRKIAEPSEIVKNPKRPTIYFICGDALKITGQLAGHYDLLFSSRFRHHLDAKDKKSLDKVYEKVPYAIEYDDYHTHLSWIPPLSTAWNRPVLLNGSILSQIRQPAKKSLIETKRSGKNMEVKIFSPPGSYAKIYSNELSWWGKDG